MSTTASSWERAPEYIVSTDLDGTFLDHHTYAWDAALPAVNALNERNIPIIFNTSKTFDEVLALQQLTGITGPCVVENGSAIYLPKANFSAEFCQDNALQVVEKAEHWQVIFGQPLASIQHFIHAWRDEHGQLFKGYSDWTIADIMQATGLSQDKAELSASKQFSEPFVWNGNDQQLAQLEADAHQHQLQILQGGRFFHLQGATDKAKPLTWLKERFATVFPDHTNTSKLICLGDNKNDIHMLNAADFPVCVKSPVAPYPVLDTLATVIYTTGLGPVGWSEAINLILE